MSTGLPRWAVALSVLAFAGLLLLVASPARAGEPVAEPPVARVLEQVRQIVPALLLRLL